MISNDFKKNPFPMKIFVFDKNKPDFSKVFGIALLVVQYINCDDDTEALLSLRQLNRNFREIIDNYSQRNWVKIMTPRNIEKAFAFCNCYVIRQLKYAEKWCIDGGDYCWGMDTPFDLLFIANQRKEIDEMAVGEGFINLKKQPRLKTFLCERIEVDAFKVSLPPLRHILELGADPNEKNQLDGKTPLEVYIHHTDILSIGFISLFKEFEAKISDDSFIQALFKLIPNSKNQPSFMSSDDKENRQIFRCLLEMGANLDISDKEGKSIIVHIAANPSLLEELINFINEKSIDKKRLLNKQADNGDSIIMSVAKYYNASFCPNPDKKSEVVELLLRNGANPEIKNKEGKDAKYVIQNTQEIIRNFAKRFVNFKNPTEGFENLKNHTERFENLTNRFKSLTNFRNRL